MNSFFRGFSLIEMVIAVAIISIISGVVFHNYANFGGRSLLRVRLVELGEYVRLAQERSGFSEVFSQNVAVPTEGFQVVRVRVRGGYLKDFRLEQAPGSFAGDFSETSIFATGRDSTVPMTETVLPGTLEQHHVDVCFIDTNPASPQDRYVSKPLVIGTDLHCSTQSMLCSDPDPSVATYNAVQARRNNFDIHLSVEQPTREMSGNVIPVTVSGATETYLYKHAEPNGSDIDSGINGRVSDTYEGIRIVFISEAGYTRSLDVYRSGLVSFDPRIDSRVGCR